MKELIGLLGAGSMGSGIAQIASTAGHRVLLYDTSETALKKSSQKLAKIMHRLVEKERLTKQKATEIMQNIQYCSSLSDLAPCKIIIEAIVENLGIKQKVFRELESYVSEDAILATNTSSLSVTAIASACESPQRMIGIHFFNPAPLMKLVEIVPALQTSKATKQKSIQTIRKWGKLTVTAKDTPGFIVNRVARPFYGEALRILEEGIADISTIDWAMTQLGGFRMGPFALMDYIGNDVNYIVTKTVYESFYYDPRYKPSFTQKQLSDAGYFGRKSGRGYYNYPAEAESLNPNEDIVLGHSIVDRIIAMLINEAADALFWQIASRDDIDMAMTKGVNYPKGLLQWADEIGISTCMQRMDDLYEIYREDRYRCSPLLRQMHKNNERFY